MLLMLEVPGDSLGIGRILRHWVGGVPFGVDRHSGYFLGRARTELVVMPPSTKSVCPVT